MTVVIISPSHRFFSLITANRQIFEREIEENNHATIYQRHKQAVSFFIIQIQRFFQLIPDSYRKGEVREIVAQYYCVLRFILKSRPHLREFLARCKHCHILFLTHPRMEQHQQQYQTAPWNLSGDRRFFSAANEAQAYQSGVKKVSTGKPGYRSKDRKQLKKNHGSKDFSILEPVLKELFPV